MTVPTTCPACKLREKGRGKYLCYDCWHELSRTARRALNRCDTRALPRLEELYDQIHRGVPLSEIQVTP